MPAHALNTDALYRALDRERERHQQSWRDIAAETGISPSTLTRKPRKEPVMSLPTLTGVGRLVEAPELRFTPTGKAVCKVRLAFNSRRKNPQTQEWEDGDVFFVEGSVWDTEAENIAQSLDKGHEVVVTGRLKTRKYETREGEKRSATELAIDSIGPTLKYATATVNKMQRSSGQQQPASNAAPDPWATAAPAGAGGSSFDDEPPF